MTPRTRSASGAAKWKTPAKLPVTGRDDGVLITVAVAERQVRIEVGRGRERTIEDDVAARIIRDEGRRGSGRNGTLRGLAPP